MTSYHVQFTLPVNNPEHNVKRTWGHSRKNKTVHFEVPLNYPNAHNVGLAELLLAADASELFAQSTALNKTVLEDSSTES